MNPDDIRSVSVGDPLSAERDEQILQAIRRKVTAANFQESNLGWHVLDQVVVRGRYAAALSDWEENGYYPNGDPRVACRHCSRNGSGVDSGESAFWVYLPRNVSHDADPSVYAGYVIYYEVDYEGTKICRSPYLHKNKIGAIEILDRDSAIPTGWAKAEGAQVYSANWPGQQFQMHNFVMENDGTYYGASPRHVAGYHPFGAPWISGQQEWAMLVDAVGGGAGGQSASPNQDPITGDFLPSANQYGTVEDGEPGTAVAGHFVRTGWAEQCFVRCWFIQRYK